VFGALRVLHVRSACCRARMLGEEALRWKSWAFIMCDLSVARHASLRKQGPVKGVRLLVSRLLFTLLRLGKSRIVTCRWWLQLQCNIGRA
jgi:hypothetical protein